MTIFLSPFICLSLLAIIDGCKKINEYNSKPPKKWIKTVGNVEEVKFIGDANLIVEYNFDFNNQNFSRVQSEISKPDTGFRNKLNLLYEQVKDAEQITIWVDENNINESSIFPKVDNRLANWIYQIKFGVVLLVFSGSLLALPFLPKPEEKVLRNIQIIDYK